MNKEAIKSIPVLGRFLVGAAHRIRRPSPVRPFTDSGTYWEERYRSGGNSGVGSYDRFASFKAEVINAFITEHDVRSVIEFGCGDGNQTEQIRCPSYLGFDVSATALEQCRSKFAGDATKRFALQNEYAGERADLTLSLDVVYHLVEDETFDAYMRLLFAASLRYVIVYASNRDDRSGADGPHIRHRKFTDWIQTHEPKARLLQHLPNRYPYRGDYRTGSFADFFFFER